MNETLFGHLTTRFAASSENLATEALHYILSRSPTACRAFVRFVSQTGVCLPDSLVYRTQCGDSEGRIPDFVGVDAEGKEALLGEAKFWAGLTDNQPVEYLRRLPEGSEGILLFVAPTKRLSTLWPELLRRCKEGGIAIMQPGEPLRGLRVGVVGGNHYLALTTWSSLLRAILLALETEGETQIAADVRQLQGLCRQMDDDAFLPIRSEELVSTNGTRIRQYTELVDQVTDTLVSEELASIKGLRAAASAGRYTRYMTISAYGCALQFNASWWSRFRETPLWLSVKRIGESSWAYSEEAEEKLYSLEVEDPSRLFHVDDELVVPLFLPVNCERSQVLEALMDQVYEVIRLLLGEQ